MSRYPVWKKEALEKAEFDVIKIEDNGHTVERLTDYHWKINGIDVWPSSKKYMKNGVIRKYNKIADVLNERFYGHFKKR